MLILASQSPRRKQLLSQVGIEFTVIPADIDESIRLQESPRDYVQRMALEKAQANLPHYPEDPILGADTIVVLGNNIFLKPKDKNDFIDMLQQLSGNTHQVLTAVALATQQRTDIIVTDTAVAFRELSLAEIENYWSTGEPQDKAGGYALQGHAAAFIKTISGSWTGVIGLPLCETLELLKGHNRVRGE
jgi:septum formation protein